MRSIPALLFSSTLVCLETLSCPHLHPDINIVLKLQAQLLLKMIAYIWRGSENSVCLSLIISIRIMMEPSIRMLKHSATCGFCFLLYLQDVRHVISVSIDLRVESLGGAAVHPAIIRRQRVFFIRLIRAFF